MDQGAEDADPVDMAGQELHDPQLHDLASVATLDSGHVHAACHACSPFLWRSSVFSLCAPIGHKSATFTGPVLLTIPATVIKALVARGIQHHSAHETIGLAHIYP
ncbi:hypothetical protein GCM10009579_09430 [Streptomyces javensis]|uniref:Uncharacterized protein n=1 Tax=Streptomyces javensis TaxID=114698 RepID=A0ABP4H8C1_9ACTN